MKNKARKLVAIFLVCTMILGAAPGVFAYSVEEIVKLDMVFDQVYSFFSPNYVTWAVRLDKESEIEVSGGKWDYYLINQDGSFDNELIFSDIGNFGEGRGAVKLGDYWGLIDNEGNLIEDTFELGYYDYFSEERIGRRLDAKGTDSNEKEYMIWGKWGFVNLDGEKVTENIYDEIKPFSEGLAVVGIEVDEIDPVTKQNIVKYGYIDKLGVEVVTPQYDYAASFDDGAALVGMATGELDKLNWPYYNYSLIYKDGSVKELSEYVRAYPISHGLITVQGEDEKWGAIGSDGEIVIDLNYDYRFSTAGNDGTILASLNNKYGIIDTDNNVVIEFGTIDQHFFNEGLAGYRDESEKVGYINEKGNIVISAAYDKANPFFDGFAVVKNGNKEDALFGLIDNTGSYVLEMKYEAIVTPSASMYVDWEGINIYALGSNEYQSKEKVGMIGQNIWVKEDGVWSIIRLEESDTYTITATAGTGGTITPNGSVKVNAGESKEFTITANSGYTINDVKVNDDSVKSDLVKGVYTFTEVAEDATIHATFTKTSSGGGNKGSSGGSNSSNNQTSTDDKTDNQTGSQNNTDNGSTTSGGTLSKYTDVSTSAWYAPSVSYVVENGLMTGTGDSSFSATESMTRAMFVKVLSNLAEKAGESITGYSTGFGDVEAGSWYADSVAWASAKGLVGGYSADAFGTNDSITREQMAVLFVQFAEYMNIELEASNAVSFTDGAEISDWAASAVATATAAGLFSGYEDGSFNPKGTATRAEVATVFMNFCELMDK